jgi:hypothetical protein
VLAGAAAIAGAPGVLVGTTERPGAVPIRLKGVDQRGCGGWNEKELPSSFHRNISKVHFSIKSASRDRNWTDLGQFDTITGKSNETGKPVPIRALTFKT